MVGNPTCAENLSRSLGCYKIVVEAELRPNKSLARMIARRQRDSDEEDEDEVRYQEFDRSHVKSTEYLNFNILINCFCST